MVGHSPTLTHTLSEHLRVEVVMDVDFRHGELLSLSPFVLFWFQLWTRYMQHNVDDN